MMPARLATLTPCIVTGINTAMNSSAASTSTSVKPLVVRRASRGRSARSRAELRRDLCTSVDIGRGLDFVAEPVRGGDQLEAGARSLPDRDLRHARVIVEAVGRETNEREPVDIDSEGFVL